MNFSEYSIRRLWSRLQQSFTLTLYRTKYARFMLKVERRKTLVHHDEVTGLPLDDIDCRRLGTRCISISSVNAAYSFVEGVIEDNILRANIVRVLKLIEEAHPGMGVALIVSVRDALWGSIDKLRETLINLLERYGWLIALLDPTVKQLKDLVKRSPILAQIGL